MDTNSLHLSRIQAYVAMFAFLQAHWQRSGSDEIAALLGSMSLLADGRPVDPAVGADWEYAILSALDGRADAALRLVAR